MVGEALEACSLHLHVMQVAARNCVSCLYGVRYCYPKRSGANKTGRGKAHLSLTCSYPLVQQRQHGAAKHAPLARFHRVHFPGGRQQTHKQQAFTHDTPYPHRLRPPELTQVTSEQAKKKPPCQSRCDALVRLDDRHRQSGNRDSEE